MDRCPLELRFRPAGPGRWLEALFLGVWLLGWLAGESLALAGLGLGLRSLVTGQALPGQAGTPPLAALLPLGTFLLVWVSFWSLGGVLAARQLLRCLWAQDSLTLTASHLEWRRQLGPFQRVRRLERRAIEAVWLGRRGSGQPLLARVAGRQLELTNLGSLEQRRQAAERLQQALQSRGLSSATPSAVAARTATAGADAAARSDLGRPVLLPEEWECLEPSFSAPLLVPARRLRRRQALLASLLALPLDGGLVLLLRQAWSEPELWPLSLMLAAVALASSWGALWLHWGRREWRLESRQLVAQRRFAGHVQELFSARALELQESSDSDGDRWYTLRATELQPARSGPARPPRSAVLCRTLHDPAEPRALGQWLARRTQIAWDDQVPTEPEREAAHRAELQRLKQQLAASGRLGQWLAGRLDRLS